jgi:phosphate starvation-inducible PhoH-like protein
MKIDSGKKGSSILQRRAPSRRQEFSSPEIERTAKRLGRQQKRLEREAGLVNVLAATDTVSRQRVVRLQDIKNIEPLTDTQADFFDSWETDAATGYVLYGTAGSGKTFLAAYHALLAVLDPEETNYHKLVIIRSSVQSRDQGHLPGDINEKMAAFEAPYASILADLTGKKDAYEKLKDMGKIEFLSTSFLRGDTFNNSIVIFDEMQNASWTELFTVATRIGKNTKIIFCGDGRQDDLHFKKNDTSGFRDFIEVSRQMPSFRNFKFTEDDIVRSAFVKEFIVTCNKLGL